MPKYLGQVVAIANDTIKNTQRAITDTLRMLERPADLMTGRQRDYRPADDGGEQLPSESQRVQITVRELLAGAQKAWVDLFDVVAARDFSNAQAGAVADVRVDGQVLVQDAPMPYLIWLGNRLDDIEKVVKTLPVHDPGAEWELFDPRGVYRSTPVSSVSKVQVPRADVIVPATEKHPAQVRDWTESVVKGYWTTISLTGAVPISTKAELIDRVHALQRAVHVAREEINRVEAVDPKPGARLMEYLFG